MGDMNSNIEESHFGWEKQDTFPLKSRVRLTDCCQCTLLGEFAVSDRCLQATFLDF